MSKQQTINPGHISHMSASDAMLDRFETDADRILSEVMHRQHATAATRMALTSEIERIVQRELRKARAKA